jgi:hypothetical protein
MYFRGANLSQEYEGEQEVDFRGANLSQEYEGEEKVGFRGSKFSLDIEREEEMDFRGANLSHYMRERRRVGFMGANLSQVRYFNDALQKRYCISGLRSMPYIQIGQFERQWTNIGMRTSRSP